MNKHGGDIYRNEIKLDFSINTSPYGIPPQVRSAISKAMQALNTYPDPEYDALKSAIASAVCVPKEWILCGNGASELIVSAVRAIHPARTGLTAPTFSGYKDALLALEENPDINTVYLTEENNFIIDKNTIDKLFELNKKAPDLIILGNPNNPTGRLIAPEIINYAIDKCEQTDTYLILDESFLPLTEQCHRAKQQPAKSDHLIRLSSYTKSMAIPGLRIGYAIVSDKTLREKIQRQLPEWNVSVPAMYAGIASAKCTKWLETQINDPETGLAKECRYLKEGIQKLGFKVFDSDTVFLLFRIAESRPESAMPPSLYDRLLKKKILIRKCGSFDGLDETYYRVAVKSHSANKALLEAVKELRDSASEAEETRVLHVLPADIEKTSFEILTEELEADGIKLTGDTAPVIKRCIHTTADFEYASTLAFSDNAVDIAKRLITEGAHIVTDTNMALSGINKKELAKYGGEAHCFMADPAIAQLAKKRGCTRASVSMEHAATLGKKIIFAVGNAPTALMTLCQMIDEGRFVPDFVIGVPVGFVNVEQAKEMIMKCGVPYIVNRGRKGGSNVAAAICNALLYELKTGACPRVLSPDKTGHKTGACPRVYPDKIRKRQGACPRVLSSDKTGHKTGGLTPRLGFTTGSCAAAASKAAAYMLLSGSPKNSITIETPKGITYDAEILDIERKQGSVSCCVIKDGGDDPDVTTGAHIYAEVSLADYTTDITDIPGGSIIIEGGTGIGHVTKPGLDQQPGQWAINSTPRQMIEKQVREVMDLFDHNGTLRVKLSVPEGETLASKTFNPRLGIEGGISIIGTSGVVEPMSSEAIIATINVEMNQKKALGWKLIPVSPGNYGLDFMKKTFGFDPDKSIKCSNFIGESIDLAAAHDFEGMLITGHIGKLAKVAGGMMNTHSKYGDRRMEVIASAAEKIGADKQICKKIRNCVATEDALDIIMKADEQSRTAGNPAQQKNTAQPSTSNKIMDKTMNEIMERIIANLRERSGNKIQIECMMYSNKHGLLAMSPNAPAMLDRIKKEST